MADPIQKIAVTGGPGSGKSTLCRLLSQMGFPVLDLDVFAKKAVEQGTPAYKAIVSEFGPSSLKDTGELNRSWLRNQMVESAGARARLEAIIHPEVYRLLEAEIASCMQRGHGSAIIEFPLLFEQKKEGLFDLVLVVFVPHEIQVERVMARDGVERDKAEGLVNLQMPLSEKALRADLVLDNSGSPEDLKIQLEEWIRSGSLPLPHGDL